MTSTGSGPSATPAPTEHRVTVHGVGLNVAAAGAGPPVLLLHGFPDSWQLWRHQIPALVAAGHRVIAPDLRGFGGSDRPAKVEDYAMRSLIGDVIGVLDTLGVERAAVVGHDWGAAVAWSLARYAPDRVSQLVAVSVGHPLAAGGADLEQIRRSWYMLWFLFPGVAEQVLPADDWAFFRRWAAGVDRPGPDADVDRRVADLARPGALTAALNLYRANIDPAGYLARTAARAKVPAVTCPTMGVWSSEDVFLTEAQMRGSAQFVTGPWRYERVEGADHWLPLSAPDHLNNLLVDFLG